MRRVDKMGGAANYSMIHPSFHFGISRNQGYRTMKVATSKKDLFLIYSTLRANFLGAEF